jgi:HlyD family secretion protein
MNAWMWKSALTTLVSGCVVMLTAYQFWKPAAGETTSWRTARVERGELLVTISATGTLEPEEVIDVGAQVAGKIQEFGKDPETNEPIDYRSAVEAGTVLAQIDSAIFQQEVNLAKAQSAKARARLSQTRAEIQASKAAVTRAEADLAQARVKFEHADRELTRSKRLSETKVVTQEQYDLHQANVDSARVAITSGEAALEQARSAVVKAEAAAEEAEADVQSAEASLRRAEQNLEYTTIRAPIKGVIIDRRVNIGQTVVASLNAPSLFLIAKDLSRLQVWVSVNEADIGRLAPGQRVVFNVDAFPGEDFSGQVRQIRLNASMTQNVVTYTVVVDVDNEKKKLLPYLTANVKFEVARLDSQILVPNAALNWRPRPERVAPEYREGERKGAMVWARDGELVRPVSVVVVDTDGTTSAVKGDDLVEGLEVVTGEMRGETQGTVVNPLLPQMQGKKKAS